MWFRWVPILLFLFAPVPVFAQASEGDRALAAIELTDRRLELAADLLAVTAEPSAASLISAGREIQERARGAYATGQYLLATRLTADARARADRAIAMLRGLPDPDRVDLQLERTRAAIERARDRLGECSDEQARGLVRVGIEMQRRAEVSAGDGRYLAALQLTMSARERIARALRLCKVIESQAEMTLRQMGISADLIARLTEALQQGGPEPARLQLSRAEARQAEARGALTAGRFELATRMTRLAHSHAQRGLRLAGRDGLR